MNKQLAINSEGHTVVRSPELIATASELELSTPRLTARLPNHSATSA